MAPIAGAASGGAHVTERETEQPSAPRPTLELVQAARLCGFNAADGWPQALNLECIAWLQAPQPEAGKKAWTPERRDQFQLLTLAADAVVLEHTSETVRVLKQRYYISEGLGSASWYSRDFPRAPQPPQYREVTRRLVTPQALAAWLRPQGQAPSALVAAWFAAHGVPADAAPQEPPQAAPAEASADIAKRTALVARLQHEWPTIEADLNEASRNGLRDAARAGTHGFWRVDKAREWAQQRGKLRQKADVHPLNSLWPGPVHEHRLKG